MSVAVKAQAKKQNCKKEQSSRDIVLTEGIKVESKENGTIQINEDAYTLMKTWTVHMPDLKFPKDINIYIYIYIDKFQSIFCCLTGPRSLVLH